MPSHHRRRKDPHDEPLPPREDSHREHSSSYRRTSSNNGRSSYDSRQSSSSSRAHRDSEWRSEDYADDYYRDQRDYEVSGSRELAREPARETETWSARTIPEPRTVPEPRYVERDWYHRDTGYSTSTYTAEHTSSWDVPSNTHSQRNGHQDRWQSQDSRPQDSRSHTTYKSRHSSQTVDERREWPARSSRTTAAYADPWPSSAEKTPVVDNRTWEPAPGWQPAPPKERYTHRYQNPSRGDYSKYSSGGRGVSTITSKSQRDWRQDDGNLNNWSRRQNQMENHRAPLPSPPPRKQYSPSPSRSPSESYYSRRSPRTRTRSPSPSPAYKRRRRDPSPVAAHEVSSRDQIHAAWIPREIQPTLPAEDIYKEDHQPPRRRYASPTPSRSSRRSRSRSPYSEPARSYGLPSSVSAPAALSFHPAVADDVSYLPPVETVNGGNRTVFRAHDFAKSSDSDSMPPPTIIPPIPELSPPSLSKPMAPTRIIAKNPGFRPIKQQNSSALRKFFPGDEDDMDISSDLSVVADPETPNIPPQSIVNRADKQQPEPENPPVVVEDEYPPPPPRLPSSPLAPSQGSSVVMEDLPEPPDPQPPRLSPPLETPRPQELDTNGTGASTPFGHNRSELYAIVSQVGEGTFGKVYKAQNTVSKQHVALKRIRMESEKEGFPVTAMREIKLLQSLRHENVVRLYEMMVSNGSVYMVFEYMDHDLTGILSQTHFSFTDAHLKSLCRQMLAGLAYLHHKGVIHRDIKGSNILINNHGELKLADFGLARFYQKRRRSDYTNRVITLWYRPPELLFGATVYGPEVDMWSAGCIMLELFTKKPVFQGNDEIHQLDTIYRVIGTPTPDRWSDVGALPWYELVKPRDEIPNHFRELFRKWMSEAALDLAERLLCYNPEARATAVQAMEAPYFTQEEPPAMAPTGLATLKGEWHELDTKRERAKKKKKE